MNKLRAGIALSLIAALAGGCKKKPPGAGSGTAAAAAAAGSATAAKAEPPAPPADDPGAESRKVNAYIECSNRFSERANQAIDRYTGWVDAKKGPSASGAVLGTYALVGDVAKECTAKLAAARADGPKLPELEAAGDKFVAALTTLEPLLADAADYYSAGVYKTDAMKHGQELHPKLLAAFAAFKDADAAVGAQLDAFEDRSLAKAMAAREQAEGRTLPFLVLQVIVTGKKVMRQATTAGQLAKLDGAALAPNVDALVAAVTELETFGRAHPPGDADAGIFVSTTAPALRKQAIAMLHHVKDKAPFESGERMLIDNGSAEMVDGTPQAVSKAYNDVVEASNRM
jgi:hypothetical protein